MKAVGRGWHLKCEHREANAATRLIQCVVPSIPQMQRTHDSITHFFTVDVEEYFQVRALETVVSREDWLGRPSRLVRSIDTLLSMLECRGARGTFFTLGWIARHRPQV